MAKTIPCRVAIQGAAINARKRSDHSRHRSDRARPRRRGSAAAAARAAVRRHELAEVSRLGHPNGGFFSAIPALAIATYSLLGLIPGLRRPNDIWQRIAGLAVGLTITSLLGLTIPGPPRPIWKALHYAIFLLAFLSAAGLCYSATRSSLVALMIPLPLLFDDFTVLYTV
jgi:hypothetical protein